MSAAVAGATPAAAGGPVAAAASPIGADGPVIVLLSDQHEAVPATAASRARRLALTRADQQPLVERARAAGAHKVKQFSLVNGFAATMSRNAQDQLRADPRVRAVVADRVLDRPAPAERPGATSAPAPAALPPGACPADPARPLLEPEALQLTHTAFADPSVPQAQALATGRGVKVAFVADGLDVRNPDLVRPDGSPVVVDFQDFSGEGTAAPTDGGEAFGDASAIAAQGRQTYDLADFVDPASPLPDGCTIRIRGIAPGASIVALKTAGAGGSTTSAVVQAIDYAVTVARVHVINESLGSNPVPDRHDDPMSLANHAAVAAGVTVVGASGDAGVYGTVGNPGGDPEVITVGASTSLRTRAQLQPNLPGLTGGWLSDNVSAISSGGVTSIATVVDLMAPGDLGWALCSPDVDRFTGCVDGEDEPSPIQAFGGTSQSAPFTAGAAALVIESYAATHGGARPSPALIKEILTSTATDQNAPADQQGAGLLNTLRAVLAARSVPDPAGTPPAQGDNLLVRQTQLATTAAPGTARDLPLQVTNVGAATQRVTARGRVLSRVLSDQRGSVQLDATAPGAPTWTNGFGTRLAFVTRTFTVPPGAAHLDASIAFAPPDGRQVVVRLLDPSGSLAAQTSAQGPSGFGQVGVHDPAPGRWTAVLDAAAAPDGFQGTVRFAFRSSGYADLGTVRPAALTLAPGQTGTFTVSASTPGQPGDLSAALQLDASTGRRLAVPLTLRSLIPTAGGRGTFTGTMTGGNGRAFAPAQTVTYRFDVPAGLRDFGINLTMDGDPNQVVFGFLESPDRQLLSQQTNATVVDDEVVLRRSLQEFRRDPAPGRWTFVVFVTSPVAGTAVSQRFSGELRFNMVDVSVAGLPNDAAVRLPAGQPVTARVTVRNTGITTEPFFVDPRRSAQAEVRLLANVEEEDVPLPQEGVVGYVVPPATSVLAAGARGSEPIDVTLLSITGSPERLARSGVGNIAVATVLAREVQPGPWAVRADQRGPFPPGGAPPATADFAAVARMQPFDPTVTSSTGNVWLGAVQPDPGPFTPLSLAPGQTGVITVTITPQGAAGTVVSGVLYVEDFNPFAETGDELRGIPYRYTVG